MMIRNLLLLTFALFLASNSVAHGQVLGLEKKPSADTDPIKLSGTIVEQKKYSFTMKDGDKVFEVKVPRGTPISMKLNRPKFDFVGGKVWVTPASPRKQPSANVGTADGTATATDAKTISTQVAFSLPRPAYLTAQFAHAAQMKRIMGAEVLRLNNYSIMASDPGAKLPSADDKPIQLAGKIDTADDSEQAVLKIGEQKFDLMLGHRGATMTAFSMATLNPASVRLTVTGIKGEGQTVTAQSIELFPVAPAKSE